MLGNMIDEAAFFRQFRDVPLLVKTALDPLLELDKCALIDFGCDLGIKTAGYASGFSAKRVIGVDINDRFGELSTLLRKFTGSDLPGNLEFLKIEPGQSLASLGPVDCVLSWSVFEHVREELITGILSDIHTVLRPGGIFFVQVNPLYFSKNGAHLWSAMPRPWEHLSGNLAVEVRLRENKSLSRAEKARAISLHKSLNQLRLSDFERYFKQAGFTVESQRLARGSEMPPANLLTRFDSDDLLIEGFQMIMRR